MMQELNITKSIISITTPGTHFLEHDHEFGRRVTRQCNEFAADLKKRRPKQFGYWASLPLPDIEGSLAEIAYVFDTLNADGVTVLTNHHGVRNRHSSADKDVCEAVCRKGAWGAAGQILARRGPNACQDGAICKAEQG